MFKSLKICVEFFFDRINNDKIDFTEAKYFKQDCEYKSAQKHAIVNISQSSTSIVTGFPGTGKTDILISEIFSNNTVINDVWVLTPTGKATSNIIAKCTEIANLNNKCIDSKLIIGTMASIICKIKYIPSFSKKLGSITLYIDEAGMIGCYQFSKFLETIKDSNIDIKKIVLFGDTNQLPPVRDKCKTSILQEYIDLMNTDLYSIIKEQFTNVPNLSKLDEIVRSNDKEICQMFKDITVGNTKLLRKLVKEDNVVKCMSKYKFKSLEKDIYKQDLIILTLKNDTVNKLNKTFQSIHHGGIRKNECYKAYRSIWEFRENTYLPGDKVMNLKNIKLETGIHNSGNSITELLSNGEIGKVIEVDLDDKNNKIVKVEYDSLKNISTYEHYNNLRHAYALTVHKSQGGEAETVVFVDSYSSDRRDNDISWGSSRELIYTALTRAKKNIIIVTNNINNFYTVLENKKMPSIKSGFTDIFMSKFDILDE